ncbi:MAG: CDP-diacylglycerol--glycerol-3-phosphate 3-phosphatidyltransferase [Coriobacteriia bacterium]|nr:CDP-diacylglycerol--glycerol-3-phosphate 3-phosphatidyltransferase [Coriobacteriia bacterium]
MADTETKNTIWTPANVVTLIRICGVPLFVAALLSPWPQWLPFEVENPLLQPLVATIIFAILACTDSVDGYLARSRNEVTTFGKFVDPLADKILVSAALLALVELQVIPSWIALLIIAREFIISGLRMIAAGQGVVIAASWYGKAKTVTQIIAILLFLMKDFYAANNAASLSNPLWLLAWAVMLIAVALTIISMLDYLYKCRFVLGFGKGEEPAKEPTLAQQVVERYGAAGLTVGTAESLTGGLIASALTDVPGSSAVVKGGVVSYVNSVKSSVLGVREDTLATQGAVSAETACQMAQGARQALGVDVAVAVTGIAGPTGAEPNKPVGTVFVGVATREGAAAQCHHFEGDRLSVRNQTVEAALTAVLQAAEGEVGIIASGGHKAGVRHL